MQTTHDDMPHPIPPIAYLRYKENWFFIIVDWTNDVYGMAHLNCEPGHDRARFSCNLMVRGELFQYANQVPFPKDFAYSKQLSDGKLTVKFVEAHTRIDVSLASDDLTLNLSFVKHAPTFDYENYDAANPEKPTQKEIVSFATHQMFAHQQQAMTIAGTLEMKSGKAKGETIAIRGMGYRDHSRAMRCDNMTLRHVWSFLYFPSTVFGAISLTGALRPGLTSTSGYVSDATGIRSLRDVDITNTGSLEGNMPATVEFKMDDVYGKPFTVIADISKRMAFVPLTVEAPSSTGFNYNIVENFCPITLAQSGERGYALVEIGFNSKRK